MVLMKLFGFFPVATVGLLIARPMWIMKYTQVNSNSEKSKFRKKNRINIPLKSIVLKLINFGQFRDRNKSGTFKFPMPLNTQ